MRFSAQTAPDLGPFGLFDAVEGREEDILSLPGRDGASVRIHPNLFHTVLEATGGPWQVVREADRLRIRAAPGGSRRPSVGETSAGGAVRAPAVSLRS